MTHIISFWKDESAQVGGIMYIFIVIIVFSLLYMTMGYVMDSSITLNNQFMQDPSFVFSQELVDALSFIAHFWYMLPVFVVLVLIIFIIKNAVRERGGMV